MNNITPQLFVSCLWGFSTKWTYDYVTPHKLGGILKQEGLPL